MTFDTLKYANRLKEAGVDPRIAETEAELLSEALDINLKELATKEDLKREINSLEQKLGNEITQLEQRMTIKLGGMMVLAISVVAVMVKLL